MAVSTNTYSVNAGWGRTDVLTLMEQGIAFAGKHGAAISGICTDVQAFHGGGTVGSAGTYYYDVPQHSTSGSGTGATFNVRRNYGNVVNVQLNKVGSGYAEGDTVTIDASMIGGTTLGAAGIGLTVHVHGGGSPVSFGDASTFFLQNNAPSSDASKPWAVQRQVQDISKKYGTTYRGFNVVQDYEMNVLVGPSFSTDDVNRYVSPAGMYDHSFRGTYLLDIARGTDGDEFNNTSYAQVGAAGDGLIFATSSNPTSQDLKLHVYKSGIDSKFTVFSFEQPGISGTLTDTTYATFFLHDFDHSLLDLDETFLGGMTLILPYNVQNANYNDYYVSINQATVLCGNRYSSINAYAATRTFESGYTATNDQTHYGLHVAATLYTSTIGDYNEGLKGTLSRNQTYPGTAMIYSRAGGFKDQGQIEGYDTRYGNRDPMTQRKLVVKGIPLNQALVPCPYYLPDDFVYIDMDIGTSQVDFRQGDTITISGSEVYTIITGSYNKHSSTAGIFFCARTT